MPLQSFHIGFVLLPQIQINQQELEQIEGLLFHVTHMNEENTNDEAQTLTVAHFFIQNRICFQNIEKGKLSLSKLLGKVGIGHT